MSELNANDLAILSAAVSQLERPSLAVRLAAVVGMPVKKLLGWLPDSNQSQIAHATEKALAPALKIAMTRAWECSRTRSTRRWYLKAAELDNAEAQLNLGSMFASGRGGPQDYD